MIKVARALATTERQTVAEPALTDAPLAQCPECGTMCKGSRALATHRRNKHGTMPKVTHFCFGTHCIACLRQFSDRKRLIQHLTYGRPACLRAIADNVQPQAEEEIRELQSLDTKRRKQDPLRRSVVIPAIRMPGPLQQWALPL